MEAQTFKSGVVGVQGPKTFDELIGIFLDLIGVIIPVIASLALLVFFWGLAKFIMNVSGDAKAVAEGKNLMIWGFIAIFIMVSIWGILSALSGEVGFDPSLTLPLLPEKVK